VFSLSITIGVLLGVYILVLWVFPSTWSQTWKTIALTMLALGVYLITIIVQQRAAFGTLVRVSPRQFPELAKLATEAAERLAQPPVAVYVKRASEMNIYTLGFWRSPLIVVTSSLVDQMEVESLQFFIGREIGHVQAGHTWLRTLLKPLGETVPIIGRLLNSVIFGYWLNHTEFTADRAGLIACRSLTVSVSTMVKFGVGVKLFEKLDLREFLDQLNEVRNVRGRVAEIVAQQPYLTARVKDLVRFALSERFQCLVPERHSHTKILGILPKGFADSGRMDLSQSGGMSDATLQDITISEPVDSLRDENALDPAHLLVMLDSNKPHALRMRLTRIGRNLDNDIVVANDRVSRYHAEIVRRGEELMIVDKGSRNGVWVNGWRITGPARLGPGDEIRIGRQEFRFTEKGASEQAS
jgi:Zn-dependent protease with chaperone function